VGKGFWVFVEDDDSPQQSESDIGVGCVVGVGILILILAMIIILFLSFLGWTSSWHTYDFPEKYVAASNYFGIYIPLKYLKDLWEYISYNSVISYPIINILLAFFAVIVVIPSIIIGMLIAFIKRYKFFRIIFLSLFVLVYVFPWIFWGGWLLVEWIAS